MTSIHLSHQARRISVFLALIFLAVRGSASAHDPGLSSADLSIKAEETDVLLTFSDRDIAGIIGEPAARDLHDNPSKPPLEALAKRATTLDFGNGPQPPTTVSVRPEQNNIVFELTFRNAPEFAQLTFHAALLKEMPFGHREAFVARDEAGAEIARHLLSDRDDSAVVTHIPSAHAPSRGAQFLEFLLLGLRHILTGYDHLLFLFGLLIVTRAPRAAILLITCFTIAHSITLALSTFGLVEIPSRLVEATIAASILYVGVENIIRRDAALHWRWLLTLAFGLIHGLGFASVLREMGIAKTGTSAIIPLVAFNAGVEVGQLAVAAIVLPIIWKLRQRPAFVRTGVPACSVLVAAAGAFWLLQRTLFS